MKKLLPLIAIAGALLSSAAFATPPCGTYQSGCVDYDRGLTELLELHPNKITSNDIDYSNFAESDYDAAGLEEYIQWNNEEYDGTNVGAPNPMTVKAVQQLKAIIDAQASDIADLQSRVTTLENQ